MASAWGHAWGKAWGNAWGRLTAPPLISTSDAVPGRTSPAGHPYSARAMEAGSLLISPAGHPNSARSAEAGPTLASPAGHPDSARRSAAGSAGRRVAAGRGRDTSLG